MKTFLLLSAALLAVPAGASADDLSNRAFQIQYDESGIHSLRRTNDVHDTDYIAPRGALGRLLIRYRTTVNGDWRELADLLPQPSNSADTIRYALGVRMPALAERSSASAVRGAGGLRALNDGEVPIVAARGGRGRGGRPSARPTPALFTWSGSRGTTQWVQYTFPDEQEVSRVEVFWAAGPDAGGASLPRSWRLLYE
ncbi:MAG TPA: hypothetical protein VFK20_07850, partial [Vicinamibacterales bacterium]|nr:hypothetical protein [Vicinamibacterales bacterium]